MKNGKLQCKDLDDAFVIQCVADAQAETSMRPGWEDRNDAWAFVWDIYKRIPCVDQKLVLRKLGSLVRRGYLTGCACGCRGDFVVLRRPDKC